MWSDLPLPHRVSGARQGYRTAYDVAAQFSGRTYLVAIAAELAGGEGRPSVSRLRYGFHVPARDGAAGKARTCWVELDNHALRASVRSVDEWTRQQVAATVGHGIAFPPEPLEMAGVQADVDEVLALAFGNGAPAPRRSEMTLAMAGGVAVWRLVVQDDGGFRTLRVDAGTGEVLGEPRGDVVGAEPGG